MMRYGYSLLPLMLLLFLLSCEGIMAQKSDNPLHPKIEQLLGPDRIGLLGDRAGTEATRAVGSSADSLWDDRFGSAIESTGLDDEGFVMVSDGRNLYVGGAFTEVGNVKADNIAVWNGERWLYVGNGPGPLQGTNGIVTDMVFYKGLLYVGGEFTVAGSDQVSNLAWYQPTSRSWVSLDRGVRSSAGGAFVADLHVDTTEGLLYVGGRFDQAGGRAAENFAILDLETKRFVARPDGPNGVVNAIEVGPDGVYVGGDFSEAGGIPARNVARYDADGNWHDLASGVSGPVNAIARMNDVVFVGGEFSKAGPADSALDVRNIARWRPDSTNWSVLSTVFWLTGEDPQPIELNGVDGAVRTLMVDGIDLYVGGTFLRAGPGDFTIDEITVQYITRWHEFQGSPLFHLTRWGPVGRGMDGFVNSIIRHDGSLYAAGAFLKAGGTPAQGISRYDGLRWFSIGTAGTGNFITTMSVRDTTVWVGGEFTRPGTGPAVAVGGLQGSTWNLAPGNITGSIFTVASHGEYVYVGGRFSVAGSKLARNVARYHVTDRTWEALGQAEGPTAPDQAGYVSSFAFEADGTVILGGRFSEAGGTPAQNIVRWNPETDTWTALGKGVNGQVFSIQVDDGNIYALGRFLGAGDVLTARNAARYDGSTWHELGAGTDQVIWTSAIFYNRLYVGGNFDSAGGAPARQLASWGLDGGGWSDVNGGVGREFLPTVNSISTNGRLLYVGGAFDSIAGVPAQNIARFDGSTWSSLGSGVDNIVYETAASDGRLYVAGAFTSAGDKPSIYFGIYYDPLLSVNDRDRLAPSFDLALAPNPISDGATLRFSTLRHGPVEIDLYDPLGRSVGTILATTLPAGDHSISPALFGRLDPGAYFVVLRTDEGEQSLPLRK